MDLYSVKIVISSPLISSTFGDGRASSQGAAGKKEEREKKRRCRVTGFTRRETCRPPATKKTRRVFGGLRFLLSICGGMRRSGKKSARKEHKKLQRGGWDAASWRVASQSLFFWWHDEGDNLYKLARVDGSHLRAPSNHCRHPGVHAPNLPIRGRVYPRPLRRVPHHHPLGAGQAQHLPPIESTKGMGALVEAAARRASILLRLRCSCCVNCVRNFCVVVDET